MGTLQGERGTKGKMESFTKISCDTETRELTYLSFVGAIVTLMLF